jgi:hypothetical protein
MIDPSWSNFYVIVGSAAGALTGLQFVVIALVAQVRSAGSMHEIRAFGSPTTLHFCAALLISALMSIPWPLRDAGGALMATGVLALLYMGGSIRHARQQTGYAADTEDWFWYAIAPLVGYAMCVLAGILLARHLSGALFLTAAVVLLLLFLGIHNAWDTVTYIAIKHARAPDSDRSSADGQS